jgi:hypothetical protein
MPCPPHSPWLDLPNDIWGRVQIMKLLTVQLPPPPVTSSLFDPDILLRALFSNTLNLCSFFKIWETKLHAHTKQMAEWWFVYFNLCIPGQQAGWQKTLNRTVASILRIQSALNFFVY